MSKSVKNGVIPSRQRELEVKSKFDAEFRRFALPRSECTKCDHFYERIESLHNLKNIPFFVTYTDSYGDQLPINNDDNFLKALSSVRGLLRLQIQRKGETPEIGFGTLQRKKKNPITKLISGGGELLPKPHIPISFPEDFRRVSSIIDVDTVPETHRRVRLMKNGSEKPLGFYIRDGVSVRMMPGGVEKVKGVFISRLVPGGLAESTGLLAVNDEVLEVNGIEVSGKTLDQVTDMMVANSSNLIVTVKPINQTNTLSSSKQVGTGRKPPASVRSHQSNLSATSDEIKDLIISDSGKDDEEDEIHDHMDPQSKEDKDSAVVTL